MTCSFYVFVTKGVNIKDGELSGTSKFKEFCRASALFLLSPERKENGFPAVNMS